MCLLNTIHIDGTESKIKMSSGKTANRKKTVLYRHPKTVHASGFCIVKVLERTTACFLLI
jgi:hypothetical protein